MFGGEAMGKGSAIQTIQRTTNLIYLLNFQQNYQGLRYARLVSGDNTLTEFWNKIVFYNIIINTIERLHPVLN